MLLGAVWACWNPILKFPRAGTEDPKWSLHWNNWRIQDPRSRQEEKLSYIHSSLKNWGVLNIKKVAGLNWKKIWRSFSAFYTTLGRHLGLETAFSFHFVEDRDLKIRKVQLVGLETALSFHFRTSRPLLVGRGPGTSRPQSGQCCWFPSLYAHTNWNISPASFSFSILKAISVA